MANMPNFIERRHIIQAIKEIDSGLWRVPRNQYAPKWCLVGNDISELVVTRYEHFPPKAVIRRTYYNLTGKNMGFFTVDPEATKFLRDMHFTVERHHLDSPH